MNNILEKIKKFIKDYYKDLIVLVIIYLLFSIKLGFSIYSPGGLINLDNKIVSKDNIYKSKGSINMTYVKLVKGTPATYVLAKLIPTWDIFDDKDISYDGDIMKTIQIDKYYLQESISNAFLVAYNKAGIEYDIKNVNSYVTYIGSYAKTDLKLFDNIKKYDNIEFTTFKNMKDYISSKNVGDKIHFNVLRNNQSVNCTSEIIDIQGLHLVDISTAVVNEYDSNILVKVRVDKGETGSSGGFMTALAIYNSITKDDITKGRVVSGTGTIDCEGNVGIIDGVTYKLSGAEKSGADIFLVPKDNYEEAFEYKKKHQLNIELVSIGTFDEAINYLEEDDNND